MEIFLLHRQYKKHCTLYAFHASEELRKAVKSLFNLLPNFMTSNPLNDIAIRACLLPWVVCR